VLSNATVYVNAAVTKNASLVLNGGDTGESLGQLRLEAGAAWAGGITLAGNITGANDYTIGSNSGGGSISGNISESGRLPEALSKGGLAAITLSGTNTYTGNTTIGAGTLQFAKTASLYNGTASSWTKSNIIVKNGATLAFNVGGTGRIFIRQCDHPLDQSGRSQWRNLRRSRLGSQYRL
jgi:autotransporter-associated beta strand protein